MIDNINIKGTIIFTLRDAETLDIISERTEHNSITTRGLLELLEGDRIESNMLVSEFDYPAIRSISSDMTVTYCRPERMVGFGDSVALTGIYDPEHVGFDNPVTLFANGTPLDITIQDTAIYNMSNPGPGTVIYNSLLGLAKFNAAEDGATITGSVTLINDLPK